MSDWRTVKLKDVTVDVKSWDPSSEPEFTYVDISSIDNERCEIVDAKRIPGSNAPSRARRPIRGGDILFSNVRTYLRNVAQVQEIEAPAVASTGFTLLRPTSELDSRFLYHLTRSDFFIDRVTPEQTGTHYPATSDRVVRGQEISLPRLDEQKSIADLIDRLESNRLSTASHIYAARRAIDRFRQAVLAAACSGRLTADWREQNPDVDGAEKLVSQRTYSIAEPEEGLAELPDKWAWVALGNYARCSRGRFSVRPRNDPSCFGGEHPFIQIGNLNPDGGWVRSHTQTLNAKGLSVSKKFPKGTAVIAIVGATIGNTGLLAYDMCFPDSLVGLETGTPEGNRFVEVFLRDRKHAIRQASYSSGGQPNIKLESLNPYPLALPPFAEQCEIVKRVERLLSVADGLRARIDAASKRVDRSSQAVLAKAFRGELVGSGGTW